MAVEDDIVSRISRQEAAMALSVAPRGFCTADHAAKMHDILGAAGTTYAARHSAYDLKKLRAKGRIEKLPGAARRYIPTPTRLRAMAALIAVRDKVLKPLLTYGGRCKPGSPPAATANIDAQYQAVQRQMQHVFKPLRRAA